MNTILLVAAVGLSAIGFASSAAAYKLSPAPTRFTATGPASATLGGVTDSGTATFKGPINKAGRGKVKSVQICGKGGCGIVVAAGLPWAVRATGATTATIANVTITSDGHTCGPATLPVAISGGVISYSGALGQCSNVSFSLTTTQALTIVR